MYNRYVPQHDGSFHRSRVPEQAPPPPPRPPEPAVCPNPAPPPVYRPKPSRPHPPKKPCQESAGGFLKDLLPVNLDAEDLLVIVLLLLMTGDCRDNRNLPLLTLALYLFL